jgi:hypothetical protein
MAIKLSDSILDEISLDNTFPESHPFHNAVWVDIDDVPSMVAEQLAEALETSVPAVDAQYGDAEEGYQFLLLENNRYALLPPCGDTTVAYQS